MTGSNRRPSACKADALPAELIPHFVKRFDRHILAHQFLIRLKEASEARRNPAPRTYVRKLGDNAASRRLFQMNGGSGWARTNDPRVINTVL